MGGGIHGINQFILCEYEHAYICVTPEDPGDPEDPEDPLHQNQPHNTILKIVTENILHMHYAHTNLNKHLLRGIILPLLLCSSKSEDLLVFYA